MDHGFSREQYREAMTRMGTAVNVVTSAGPAGRLGFTASAVCSVSDTPATLLVCMNRNSAQNAAIKENGVLCVNTLGAGQEEISAVFAGQTKLRGDARFQVGLWCVLQTGAPVLSDAAVSFDCLIDQTMEVFTHSVLICRVQAISEGNNPSGLCYFGRTYHAFPPCRSDPIR
ncbi:MAG TPA: flavin reductase [Stellaceae bacterium]|nr:flavin reductase [Stellaceae bacterium]